MNKIVLIILFSLVAIINSFGQIMFNFEDWKTPERAVPFDWSEPENWTSTNRLTEFINPGITQTSDAYEGNAAVLISSLQIFGTTTTSSLVLGNGLHDFKAKTISLDGAGLPIDQRLVKVSAWYKYENSQNTGAGSVEIIVSRWVQNENKRTILAYETAKLPLSDSYKQMEINLDIDDYVPQMDSVILVFHSEENTNGALGVGKLYVDDVRFGYVSNTNNPIDQQTYIIHPNPVSKNGFLTIIDHLNEPKNIRLYDLNGRIVRSENTETSTLRLDPFLESGLYILEIATDREMFKSKVIITE
jgi:hypothetical protein